MALINLINKLDKRFAWSLYGFVLAAILAAVTIYIEFFRDERPAILMEVISNFNVLDVKEDVPDLSVVFGGTDLRESGQSLRIIVLRVQNIGLEDVLISYYDEKAPLGFSVNNGSIINIDLQNTSESYLADNLTISARKQSERDTPLMVCATSTRCIACQPFFSAGDAAQPASPETAARHTSTQIG